ncbi:peptidase S8/S53 domain-containing protein [Mycena leptocephala]|nr:peptidase S8/S53 domain-containing protein [Mycena leptocephala]
MELSAGPFPCHQIPLFNMHVAGCIVFLALSLPVFAVPVLKGPNVGARTTKSTRTTHATPSTKLATKSPVAKPTTLPAHVTTSAKLATTADHTTTTSKRTTTVKTSSSAKISMTPPKSSAKPSATSSPKPSAVISPVKSSSSVRPIVSTSMKIAPTLKPSSSVQTHTPALSSTKLIPSAVPPKSSMASVSSHGGATISSARPMSSSTRMIAVSSHQSSIQPQSARPSISTVAVSHGSTVSSAPQPSSSPTHTPASSGGSLSASASGHSTAPASWNNLRPPAGPSASSARVSHGSAASVSSAPTLSASNAGSSAAPSASDSVVASEGTSISSSISASAPSASCGPVPTNTIPNFPDALPNQYIVSLKPNANVTHHLANVQAALAADKLCEDPGAPASSLDLKQVLVQDTVIGVIYRGNFTDRDVAFIQTTSEFQSITRDRVVVESRKRAVGTTWNLARLAQADKLQPGQPGQGTSDTSSDWSVGLKDGLGQDVYIYVVDTGVDGNHPLLTSRVQTGIAVTDREPGNIEGDGHGTEVAGPAAAINFGVASAATIVPIKISSRFADLEEVALAINEAIDNFRIKKMKNSKAVAVINISLTLPNDPNIQRVVAEALEENMHVVIAAGNQKEDRCKDDWVTTRTNTNVQAAINVGATDINDQLAVFPTQATEPGSNYGECVDIYAGGYNILTSGPNKSRIPVSGTSVAAPQIAGMIAAIISTTDDGFKITPADMKTRILNAGVKDKIGGLSADSNNLLAQLPDSLKQAVSTTNPAPPTGSAAPDDADSEDDWGDFTVGAPGDF